ncbi:MAG: hypothetical protein LBR49_04675 [Tannerella sp.]|jgi:hypothetical protein|nr:hypothetical protein [Tannerella sp.]
MKTKFLLAVMILSIFASCKENDPSKNIYQVEGMILYQPWPDSCEGFVLSYMGEKSLILLKPSNLSEHFQIDSLKVKVSFQITEEDWNCGIYGYRPIINILSIRKL